MYIVYTICMLFYVYFRNTVYSGRSCVVLNSSPVYLITVVRSIYRIFSVIFSKHPKDLSDLVRLIEGFYIVLKE